MRITFAQLASKIAVIVAVACAIPSYAVAESPAPLSERQRVLHVLNRLGFGPRQGDVERVEAMGIERYVQQQLHPEQIDDTACEKSLSHFDTLQMTSGHLLGKFYTDIKGYFQMQMASGNAQEVKLRTGLDLKASAPAAKQPYAAPASPDLEKLSHADAIRCVGELQQAKLIRAALSERQLQEVLVDFWSNHFNVDVKKAPVHALKVADDRYAIRPHVLGRFRDLLGASAHSPAMLAYLDNKENSVPRERSKFEKGAIEFVVGGALGMSARGMVPDREGPNENYGREILELHTLGVDGGYTQKDVQEVARCFTGWTYSPFTGNFDYQANRHDQGEKTLLGHVIRAGGGARDGELVLDLLAAHPSTAKFIGRKLCQRFVSDDPPAELVSRVSKVFLNTDGDLRQVVLAIVTSPEFFSTQTYRTKIKSPFEFAVSAVRATGATFDEPRIPIFARLHAVQEGAGTMGYGADGLSGQRRQSLNWHVYTMGEPLFAHTSPTGYPEDSSKWVSPGALIDRLNFAMALANHQLTDVSLEPSTLTGGIDADQPRALFDRMADSLLHGALGAASRKTLERSALAPSGESRTVDVPQLTALILGSPEFQRR